MECSHRGTEPGRNFHGITWNFHKGGGEPGGNLHGISWKFHRGVVVDVSAKNFHDSWSGMNFHAKSWIFHSCSWACHDFFTEFPGICTKVAGPGRNFHGFSWKFHGGAWQEFPPGNFTEVPGRNFHGFSWKFHGGAWQEFPRIFLEISRRCLAGISTDFPGNFTGAWWWRYLPMIVVLA